MRRHVSFISTIVVVIIAIIYFALTLREQNLFYFHGEKKVVQDFIESFRGSHAQLTELNLTSMYGGSGQFQILHPMFAMKSLRLKIQSATCSPGEAETTTATQKSLQCDFDPSNLKMSDADLITSAKQQEFVRILRREATPSDDFILNPPFVDESGNSYAYLLSRKDIAPFSNASWVRGHLSFFKTAELKEVMSHYKIDDPTFATIGQLSVQEIKSMVEGDALVITPNYLLLKNQSRLGFSPLSYWVYDIREVRTQLKEQDYDLVTYTPDTFCLERIGNACWTYSSKTAMAYVYRYALIILSFAILIFVILSALYAKYVIDKNREQNKHRTSLQVLSHEFRTPVSAMLLLIDEFTKDLNRLNERDQDTITKISAETFRLQRIIEMSKTYLQSTSDAKRFNYIAIPSINTWIGDFASDFDSRIRCELLPVDQAIEADPFWLRFALANLVQNAFTHGSEPVFIRLLQPDGRVSIVVEDQGVCEFDSLKKMSEAFIKSQKSGGMGLGLNITNTIIHEWGGALKFRRSPTSFAIALNENRKGSKV